MVFVDTSAFLARHARRDPFNKAASVVWQRLESTPLVTTNHVIEETLTLLGRRIGHWLAADLADRFYSSQLLEIICSDHDDEREALNYFRKFADQRISFTDCISFAIMKRNRISTAFTFDRHFRHAGFELLGHS